MEGGSMKGMTPVQRRMVTVIGAKQGREEKFCENPTLACTWMAEALEVLLLREIERAAENDNVDINDGGLIEAIQREGAAEMAAAAEAEATDNPQRRQ